MKIIFFDTETNGFKGTSVLSISAIKVDYDEKTNTFKKDGEFNRFYFRNEGEEVNEEAVSINGLTDEVIRKEREKLGFEYPETFKEDMSNFNEFCKDTEHYVAHNIKFDRDFIDFPLKNQFDTMLANVDVLKLPGKFDDSYKWPRLSECAKHYKVPIVESDLHGSYYDVLVMFRVFYKMSADPRTKNDIMDFMGLSKDYNKKNPGLVSSR